MCTKAVLMLAVGLSACEDTSSESTPFNRPTELTTFVLRVVDRGTGEPLRNLSIVHPGAVWFTLPDADQKKPAHGEGLDWAVTDAGLCTLRVKGFSADYDHVVISSAEGHAWKTVRLDPERSTQLVTLEPGGDLEVRWPHELPVAGGVLCVDRQNAVEDAQLTWPLGPLSDFGGIAEISQGTARFRMTSVPAGEYHVRIGQSHVPDDSVWSVTPPWDPARVVTGQRTECELVPVETLDALLADPESDEAKAYASIRKLEFEQMTAQLGTQLGMERLKANAASPRVRLILYCDGLPVKLPRGMHWAELTGLEPNEWTPILRSDEPYALVAEHAGSHAVRFYDFGEYVFPRKMDVEFVQGETREVVIDATLRW